MPETGPRRVAVGRILLALLALLLIAGVAFVLWAGNTRSAEPGPLARAVAEPAASVALEPVIELRPADRQPRRGVVFYPGARVDPEAYVATWVPIVLATDTLVLIPRMPLDLAVLGRSSADALIDRQLDRDPGLDEWWVGGHSLGGSMAASWLGGQPVGRVDGLLLWASYSTRGAGLEERLDLDVLSVSGSRDGLATPEDIYERATRLPDGTVFVEISGMNHAQFGRYGDQGGDLQPTIDDREAQRRLVAAHASFWNEPGVDVPTEEPA